jgi:hypothetical protein
METRRLHCKASHCSGGEFEAASTTAVAARKQTWMVLGERLQVLQQNCRVTDRED